MSNQVAKANCPVLTACLWLASRFYQFATFVFKTIFYKNIRTCISFLAFMCVLTDLLNMFPTHYHKRRVSEWIMITARNEVAAR